VADDNDAALALFRARGFKIVPGSLGRYARGQNSHQMARVVLPRRS
jgi:ribosomal protein S18 acetylase RimI-like enzyme